MHWVIDAMNVIGSRPDGWWRDREAAIAALVERLDRWAGQRGAAVTVVLERPPRRPIEARSVGIVAAGEPGRDAADREIVRRLPEWLDAGEVTVVTSDRALADAATRLGAAIEPASSFRRRLDERQADEPGADERQTDERRPDGI